MQMELPEFEKTLVALAVELLGTPQEYSDYVIAQPDAQGEVSRKAMRVTLHYLTALLAYGFPVGYGAVRQVAEWFVAPFPTEQHDRLEMMEMSRLEALLSLRPIHESVMPRLRQLMVQSSDDGLFDLDSSNIYFDTLWSLKVLNMARRANLPESVISVERLREQVDDYLQTKLTDKDLALALNLRYELHGSLTEQQQERHLQKLLDNWQRNNGLWDVPSGMAWIPDNLRRQQLSFAELRAQRDPFRKMILSTCYVVENLAPLIDLYPDIVPTLRGSVELWWNVFYQNPTQVLHELFPEPYDYVIMLARTLIMLRALVNEPLIEWGATRTYDELIAKRDKSAESHVRRNLRRVLEQLIVIDFDHEPEELRHGLSGANIVRVQPHIQSWYDESNLKLADSLIIKYGAKEDIDAERANYQVLPDSIQNCYVRIPRDTYSDAEEGVSYVVIRDLHDYVTLYEGVRNNLGQLQKPLMRELPPFLLYTHAGGEHDVASAPPGIIQDLYLLPMQTGISTIFKALRDRTLLIEDGDRAVASHLYLRLNDLCADLLRRQSQLEKFPKAYMHGDLHSRNIMIRQNARRNNLDQELDFKLIDLEKFSPDGDAAMDLGELLVDLEVLLIDIRNRSDRRQHPLAILARTLHDAYHGFAENRHDDLFEARLALAQARFSIRIAKGKTRLLDPAHRKTQPSATDHTVSDILHHCESAATYLETVLSKIGSGSETSTSTPPSVSLPEEER